MKLYSIKEATRKTDYANDSYVRKLILDGKVNAHKVGNTWIFTKKQLKKLEQRRNKHINKGRPKEEK